MSNSKPAMSDQNFFDRTSRRHPRWHICQGTRIDPGDTPDRAAIAEMMSPLGYEHSGQKRLGAIGRAGASRRLRNGSSGAVWSPEGGLL